MSSLFIIINGNEYEVSADGSVRAVAPDAARADTNGAGEVPAVKRLDDMSFHVLHEGRSSVVRVERVDERSVRIATRGSESVATVLTKRDRLLERFGVASGERSSDGVVKAPMPGLVLRVLVDVGDAVSHGEGVLVLEAMKMENELASPVTGRVAAIHAAVGEAVGKNALLVEITGDD